VVSIGTSALGGALGMASGIFIVPVLTLFGRLEIHAAVAASIVSVIACSCGSARAVPQKWLTNIRVAIVLEVATTLGALTGVLLAGILSVSFLYFLFAAVLLVSASQMMARRHEVFGRNRRDQSPGLGDFIASSFKLSRSRTRSRRFLPRAAASLWALR